MVTVFACEDNALEAEHLTEIISAVAKKRNLEVDFQLYECGEHLLMNFERGMVDVVFLDIVVEGSMNGLEIARRIQAIDRDVPLVFVTSSLDYALESYAVQAVHYLVKPLKETDVEVAFDRCVKLFTSSRKTIDLVVNRVTERVLIRDIVYAEVFGNRSNVRLTNLTFATYTPLSALIDESNGSFLRCHRSYVVNMDHILRVRGKEFLMDNGSRVPIRTNGCAAVVASYQKYLARNLRS